MKTQRVPPKLICLLCLFLLCNAHVFARGQRDSVWITGAKNIRVVHEQGAFDIAQSSRFFGRRCLITLDCLSFPLGGSPIARSLSPKPDRRALDERIADTFMMVTAYPGGKLLYNTVCAGLELLLYSEQITSIKYDNLKIGSSFGGTGRGFLKTGVFYNF